jgi:hypothetical protein
LRREPFAKLDVFCLLMSLLPRKGLLAIAAVVNVALRTEERPISAKTLATRHGRPPRHLESVLQSLVHVGILKGIRGLHGRQKALPDLSAVQCPTGRLVERDFREMMNEPGEYEHLRALALRCTGTPKR